MTVYIIDTNVFSDIVAPVPNPTVLGNLARHRQDTLCRCEAVDYEIRRGYLKTNATTRLATYESKVKQQFQWVTITEADWKQAARFWADMANMGKAFSDVVLLIAAVAKRLGDVIVSADADFDALPIQRENWRIT
ncbi:MAG: type II toxin-antitoxin system VapC family toxin [Anaerolineae bacterium]|nr:type II toxin-antitoxin system VapC family toxin [Anaerolineae bacterium]